MLDFYKISDESPKPDWPEKVPLERIGGLEIKDFEDLKKKNLIENRFDYSTDFRWNKNYTFRTYNLLLSSYPGLRENNLDIPSVNALFGIVEKAVLDSSGLIAYAD